MKEQVILVDKHDNEIGVEEKIKAHKDAKLHRAFSIFVFNSDNKLLLQRRATSKYHSGGLWANTCCGHPRPGEGILEAAHRRLGEEMGFDCDLKEIGSFIYKRKLDNDLYEHELDHVFIGHYDGELQPNPEEVEAHDWFGLKELKDQLLSEAEKYAVWFEPAFEIVLEMIDEL